MNKNITKDIKFRLTIIIFFIIILFSYVFYTIFSLYFIKGKKYSKIAKKQYKSYFKINMKRGEILDRNLKQLAISIPAYSLYAFPKKINNKDKLIKILQKELNLEYKYIFRKLFSKKRNFVYIKRQLSKDKKEKINAVLKKEKITGLGFETESKRFYPQEELAAQVLGFTGRDSKGLYGIERKFNKELKFKGEKLKGIKNAKRNIISLDEKDLDFSGKYNQVQLTIDSFIQYISEEEIKKVVNESKAKKAMVIVTDPYSGEIYAMAQYPSFNPNSYKDYKSKLWKSQISNFVYEPGSTMKAISIASAIDSKKVSYNEKFDCENGEMSVGRYIIHDTHPYKLLNVEEILAKSSNIGTLKIINKLGRKNFFKYVNDFHFGKKYNFYLGSEKGLLQPYKRWKTAALANIAFGQGISVTPLQLINAFNAIINGGNLMKPKLVSKILNEKNEIVKEIKDKVIKKVISKKTSKITKKLLQSVVSIKGTAPRAIIKGVEVGGKTGTAQKVDSVKKTYSDKRIASFIGYFKKNKIEFSILVLVDEPQTSNYGGVIAAPVFRNIAIKILKYYHISVDEEKIDFKIELPQLEENLKLLESLSSIESLEEKLSKNIDNNKIKTKIIIKTVPNFIGLTLREALELSKKENVNIKINGSGTIYKTKPKEFSEVKNNETIELFFKEYEY